ncbi:MAG TPA: AbrB family transcriptional regulator [Rhizobiaceae bacterium]|nr:AbrB family transcriptional regulator [Rhizobiaceae bacterium]
MIWVRYVATLALGALGGWIFYHFHIPLAWMLGAMTLCIVGALMRAPLAQPSWLTGPMISVVGVILGATFTPEMFHDAGRYAVTMGGLVLYVILTGLISVFYLRRFAGYDLPTSYFSGMPGGFAEMIIAGEQFGGDGRRIALSHSSRVFIVVFALPAIIALLGYNASGSTARPSLSFLSDTPLSSWIWLAACIVGGSFAGRLLRLPAPMMVGPLLVSALVHGTGLTDFTAPPMLVIVAQVVLGTGVGSRFVGVSPMEILRALGHSLACNGVIVALTLLCAFGIGHITGMGVMPLLLAYSPGGLTEMSLMGLALNVEVAFVATHHIVRVLLVMSSAALVFSLLARKPRP